MKVLYDLSWGSSNITSSWIADCLEKSDFGNSFVLRKEDNLTLFTLKKQATRYS